MASDLIGGIEGGATHSSAVLLDPSGRVVVAVKGPANNHYLTGVEEWYQRIADIVNEAKRKAKIPLDQPLTAIGLSMTGCELEEQNQQLVQGLKILYPDLALDYAIASDTDGSIAAASNEGGVVCISGTGSNTLLIKPDKQRVQCGGWGHLLGDENSAWGISHQAIKTCIDDLDGFQSAPHSIENIWNLIKKEFNVKEKLDVLNIFYPKLDKSKVAHLCKLLADVARSGDLLAKFIFNQAGEDLAKCISAVYKQAPESMHKKDGGFHVICVGSVWLSWDLLQQGFFRCLKQKPNVDKLTLLKLKCEDGVGAAYMVADKLQLNLKRQYTNNYDVFARYTKS